MLEVPRLAALLLLAAPLVPAEPGRNAMPHGFGAFLDWLQAGADAAGLGAEFPPFRESFELRRGRFGQALFAARRFERGETLALIPLSHLVTELNYSDGGGTSRKVGGSDMYLYLARQRQAGAASPWAPYYATLPDEHSCLPHNWEPGLLDAHLRGSHAADAVREQRSARRREYDNVASGHGTRHPGSGGLGVSWEEFLWASDTHSTRALTPTAGVAGLTGRSVMFPLFDLALHDDERNMRARVEELEATATRPAVAALVVDAKRLIRPGDEILNWYIGFGTMSSWTAVKQWGFTTERCSREMKEVRLVVTPESVRAAAAAAGLALATAPPNAKNFTLFERHGQLGETLPLLSHLRTAAGGGAGAGQTWRTELVVARLGAQMMEAALGAYPHSVEEDEALLGGDFEDPRVRFMVMLRRDEKLVLHGWRRLLRRMGREAEARLDSCKATAEPVPEGAASGDVLPGWDCGVEEGAKDYLLSPSLGGWEWSALPSLLSSGHSAWESLPPATELAWLELLKTGYNLRTDAIEATDQAYEFGEPQDSSPRPLACLARIISADECGQGCWRAA